MTAQELDTAINEITRRAETKFMRGVRGYQDFIVRELELLVLSGETGLTVDRNGTIRRTAANIRRIRAIKRELGDIVTEGGLPVTVAAYAQAFDPIEQLLADYFTENMRRYRNSEALQYLASSAKERTLETMLQTGTRNAIIDPIADVLDKAINGNTPRVTLIEEFKAIVQGKRETLEGGAAADVLGSFERYANLYVRDSLNQYAGNYAQSVTESLGLQWYYYAGTVVDDTRQFCKDRVGKYWHQSEVEGWASLQWSGKIPTTNPSNIVANRGGYNCRHQLIPVSDDVVPETALARV